MTSNKKKLFPASLLKLRRPFKESKQNNKESNEHKKIKVISRHEMIFSQRRIHAYTRISTRSPLQFQHAISYEMSLRVFFRFRILIIIFVSHFFLPFVLIFQFELYIMNTLVVHSTSAIYLPQIYLCRVNCVILHNEQVCTNWMYFSILFCLEENECRSNRSKCEQLCVNTISGYYCECKKGYQLNGKYSCKGRLFGNYYYHLSDCWNRTQPSFVLKEIQIRGGETHFPLF